MFIGLYIYIYTHTRTVYMCLISLCLFIFRYKHLVHRLYICVCGVSLLHNAVYV